MDEIRPRVRPCAPVFAFLQRNRRIGPLGLAAFPFWRIGIFNAKASRQLARLRDKARRCRQTADGLCQRDILRFDR